MDKENEIKYKVNTIIKTNTQSEKELIETFNKKLLKRKHKIYAENGKVFCV